MKFTDRLRERARRLKAETAALYLAFKRKETPVGAKIIIGIAVCYALSPIDLIPDFIPVIGFLDDVLLLPLLVALAIRMIPEPVMAECREQAAGMWENGRPKSLRYALPVLVVWLVVAAIVVKAFLF